MLKAIIKSISNRYLLDPIDWDFITTHLNQPLVVLTLNFDDTGELYAITVSVGNVYGDSIILFIEGNEVEYKLIGELTKQNYTED